MAVIYKPLFVTTNRKSKVVTFFLAHGKELGSALFKTPSGFIVQFKR